jgi:rhodanese-related sulfurtransferase
MNQYKILAALVAVLILGGCAAPPAPPSSAAGSASAAVESAAEPAAESAAESAAAQEPALELASLPRDLDVQTAASLSERSDVVILDVREQDEWDAGHIPGALFIPMSEIQSRLSEVPSDKTVIVQCRSGSRSSQVTDFLQQQGFSNVRNMAGGLNAWQSAGLPVEQ